MYPMLEYGMCEDKYTHEEFYYAIYASSFGNDYVDVSRKPLEQYFKSIDVEYFGVFTEVIHTLSIGEFENKYICWK